MHSDVTVLIPAYGASPYLRYTIESINESTSVPFEIIVVDDGINPEILSLLVGMQLKSTLHVVRNEGRGLVHALNTGLRHAKSKYICRIDNDDLMAIKRIEIQVKTLQENPELVAVGTQCIYVDEVGIQRGKSMYPLGDLRKNVKFQTSCLIAHPSSMYLKNAALSVGGYRSLFKWNGIDIAEDFDFWLRISKIGGIQVINEYLTFYRQHPNQLSSHNLIGQALGTPYVAALNLDQTLEPICLEFSPTELRHKYYLVKVVAATLGPIKAAAVYLTIVNLRMVDGIISKFFNRTLSRLINLLNQ